MDSGFMSFEKLQEVGFSPYLGFIPIFGIEAIMGDLIGPKPWDRININFWKPKC